MKLPQPPFPVPLRHLRGGDIEVGKEDEPGKSGEKVFLDLFLVLIIIVCLIGNILS